MRLPVSNRGLTSLIVLLVTSGCMGWRPATIAPRQLIEEEQPKEVRVSRSGESRLFLRPWIENDSIHGCEQDPNYECALAEPIALEDVATMEVKYFRSRASVGMLMLSSVPFWQLASLWGNIR